MRRPHWFFLIAIALIWIPAGCALFNSSPRLAHIQIVGPGNHTKEFVLCLDDLKSAEPAGINLNERYTIEIDFQWLWYEAEDLDFNHRTFDTESPASPLTPWFICKYRF